MPEPSPGIAASRAAPPPAVSAPPLAPSKQQPAPVIETRRSDNYYQVKATIFGALIEAIDLAQLAKLDSESAREEIRDIVNEIIAIKNIVMSIAEQEELLDTAPARFISKSPARFSAPASASATTSSSSTSASASSARLVAGLTSPRRSAMRAWPTARASTPSCRRWRSTARRSRSASSRRTS
jgi:hypothetical protein